MSKLLYLRNLLLIVFVIIMPVFCFADTTFVQNTIAIPDSVLIKSLNSGPAKSPFWDNWPSILISFISTITTLIALCVTYVNTRNTISAQSENLTRQLLAQEKNLEKQLNIQLVTTIEKEWTMNVRLIVTEILRYAHLIYLSDKNENWQGNINGFLDNHFKLMLLLNEKKVAHKKVLDAVQALAREVIKSITSNGDHDFEILDYREMIVLASHELLGAISDNR